MLEGLQSILDKKAVLSTVNANDLLQNPQKAEEGYQRHVATFVPMGDVSGFVDRLARRVMKSTTPKGIIVAPYGYGKTSTLAFLWHECEEKDLVAVPPFYCSNLLDILKATYGWVRYRLQYRQPALVSDLDAVYRKYTTATVGQMAESYAKEHGIARITAKGLLEDMLQKGNLVLELTPSNLLFFLDETSRIVKKASFQGLVILPDEFQQYINKGANLRRTIQEFREFVWGLDTRTTAMGVVISVPDTTEGGVIQEHGKDILHRLKKDDLYYRLQDIYTRRFPAELWDRYRDEFRLNSVADQVIDRATLLAIGQIIEREDLGEGPRTVVDSFKRAILCYQDKGHAYTPIDLIDDFLESNIRFQAQANTIKRVTRQVLNSTVVDSPEKTRAVKLMAAFPRGCPVSVQRSYNVYESVSSLSKQAHGELMTHLVEGYTLLGLQRGEVPTQTVDVIITRFWRTYDEDDFHIEAAIRAFTNRLLPRFFQRRRGTSSTGWGEIEFMSSAQGSQMALIEGTFNPRFPHRTLGLQVAYSRKHLQPLLQGADFQFDFLFCLDGQDTSGELTSPTDRIVRFNLNTRQRVKGPLPSDIQKLQEFVNPEFVTPLLMLSLIDYFERWEEISDTRISESDRSEIEFLINRLLNHTAQILLNRGIAESIDPQLQNVGGRMIEELFNRRCASLFPNYSTLYVQARHEKIIDAYVNAMRDMTLKQRRGHSSLDDTKESLARRFGLGSVSTFNNRIQNEYKDLMSLEKWAGRGDSGEAEIILRLHPLEEVILKQLRTSSNYQELDGQVVPVLNSRAAAEIARPLGYRDEETLLALQLLAARGYVRFDMQRRLIYLVQIGPDSAELESKIEHMLKEVENIPQDLLDEEKTQQFHSVLGEALNRLNEVAEDEEELDELQMLLVDMEQDLDDLLSDRRGSLRQDLNKLILEVDRKAIDLGSATILDREVEGQVAFVMHLNELRQKLSKQRRKLVLRYEAIKTELKQALSDNNGGPVSETLDMYQALQRGISRRKELTENTKVFKEQLNHLRRWITLLQDTDRLFNSLERTPDLQRELTREVIPQIQVHLTKQRIEGLDAWENFQLKVKAVEAELEKRRRHGNERFGEVKEEYEDFLRAIDVKNYRPTTRYTYGEDEGSYHDLYLEVKTKIEHRLIEIENDLEQNEVDLLKAEHVQELAPKHQSVVPRIKEQIEEVKERLQSLQRVLTISLIRSGNEELEAFGRSVQNIAETVIETREELGPILYTPRQLSEAEHQILEAFGQRHDIDPTDLFVSLRQQGSDLDWQDLIELIDHLYRKNRILIRISQRG